MRKRAAIVPKVNPAYEELVPPLSGQEFADLKADIEARGVVDKIVVDDQGNILDGHHRFKCDKDAPFCVLPGVGKMSEEEKHAYVIRRNINRRNLSPEQKKEVGQHRRQLAYQLYTSDEDRWTQQAIADVIGVAVQTISDWKREDAWDKSNSGAGNPFTPSPARTYDKRLKLPPDEKKEIAREVGTGNKTQAQVAADHGISQVRVSQVAKASANASTRKGKAAVDEKKHTDAQKASGLEAVNNLQTLVDAELTFGCIYADPPWQYGNQGTRASTDKHYATMTVEAICAEPVAKLAADNCHLHLWTTNAFLFEAKRVMESWGFEYKSCFIWVKPQIGLGNYWRVAHEFLLLGVKGDAVFKDKRQRSWLEAKRGKHSAKPAAVRQLLTKVSPGPFLEMYARKAIKGWTVYGDEAG